MIKVSAIIATKDRYDDILKCLQSINAQTYLPLEIIIVDSSSDERLKIELAKRDNFKMPIKYIRSGPGLPLQRNTGVKAASGELLAFFDDDVVLNRDFIEQIMPIFVNDKEKKIGGATGRITNEPRSPGMMISFFRFITFFSYPANGKFRISGFHTEYNGIERSLKVEWLPGAVNVYRREVFDELLFDENLKGYAYSEDIDFSYRVSRKYECWYIPSAKVEHHKSARRLTPAIARDVVATNNYLLHKNILPNKNVFMKFLHITTFYIAIFSFMFFLLITFQFGLFKGAINGLNKTWFKRD